MNRLPRFFLAAAAVVAFGGSYGRADTELQITGAPATYTPGQSFTFEVTASGDTILAMTNFQIALTLQANNASNFGVGVGKPSDLTQFVFGTQNSALLGASGVTSTTQDFTISSVNFSGQPVNVVAGQNDVFGVVTVTTSAALTGPITIGFDSSNTSMTTLNPENVPILTFQSSVTVDQASSVSAVPTPAAWALMAVGMVALTAVGRRRSFGNGKARD